MHQTVARHIRTAGFLTLLLCLTGCSAAVSPAPEGTGEGTGMGTGRTPGTVAAPSPIDATTNPTIPSTVASGTWQSTNGDVTGAISIGTTVENTIEVHLDNFAISAPGTVSLSLLDQSEDVTNPCYSPGFAFSTGDVADTPQSQYPLGPSSTFIDGDPSFLASAVLVAPATDTDCAGTIIATARLVWTLPPARTVKPAEDSGRAPGAMGEAKLDGGSALSYTVAAGDTLDNVAARFGIADEDILYLNPTRHSGGSDEILAGETLNLRQANR